MADFHRRLHHPSAGRLLSFPHIDDSIFSPVVLLLHRRPLRERVNGKKRTVSGRLTNVLDTRGLMSGIKPAFEMSLKMKCRVNESARWCSELQLFLLDSGFGVWLQSLLNHLNALRCVLQALNLSPARATQQHQAAWMWWRTKTWGKTHLHAGGRCSLDPSRDGESAADSPGGCQSPCRQTCLEHKSVMLDVHRSLSLLLL